MITEKQIEKSIVDFFKVENNITKWGRIKKHSNVCWEYFKYDESITHYNILMTAFRQLIYESKITEKSLPFRKNIMNFSFKRLIICENKQTGINLLKRYNEDLCNFDLETVNINNKEYYIFW